MLDRLVPLPTDRGRVHLVDPRLGDLVPDRALAAVLGLVDGLARAPVHLRVCGHRAADTLGHVSGGLYVGRDRHLPLGMNSVMLALESAPEPWQPWQPWHFLVTVPLDEPADFVAGSLLHELGHVVDRTRQPRLDLLRLAMARNVLWKVRGDWDLILADERRAWDWGETMAGPFAGIIGPEDLAALREACLEMYTRAADRDLAPLSVADVLAEVYEVYAAVGRARVALDGPALLSPRKG